MKRLAWLLALLLLAAPAHAQDADKAKALEAEADGLVTDNAPMAIVRLSQALREWRQLEDVDGQARVLTTMGRVLRDVGRYAEALDRFMEAWKLDTKAGNARAAAADLAHIGTTHAELGQAKKAFKVHRDAARAYQALGDGRATADVLVHLANDQRDLLDLAAAEETLHMALRLYRALKDHSGRGDVLTNLASLQAATSRFDEAIRTGREAIDAFKEAGDDVGRGVALHNLGNLYARLGDIEQALQLYHQARPLLAGDEQAAADHAVGDLWMAGGDAQKAAAVYREALADATGPVRDELLWSLYLAEDTLDPDGPAARAALEEASRSGDNPRVRLQVALRTVRTAREASAVAKEAAARMQWSLQLEAMRRQAELIRDAGGDPLPVLRAAGELVESRRRRLEALDTASAQRFARSRRWVYVMLVDTLLAQGDGASALLWSERLRQAELAGDSADPDALRLQALGDREAELEKALATAQARDNGAEQAAALDAELAALRVEFSRFVDELRTRHPDFDQLVRIDPTDIEAWQGDLADDELVLQPILLPDRLVLLAFSNGPMVFREVEVAPDAVRKRVSRVLKTMRTRRLSNVDRLNEHLDALGTWLLEPVADLLAEHRRVVVIADGPLRYLPMQAVRRNGAYLVSTHDVVNVTNVGSLKRRDDEALRMRDDALLALGNPDGSLPAADAEVAALAGLFPGARVLQGPLASETQLVKEAPSRAVLHLATHGVLDPQAPERSYIVLAPEQTDDGRLGYLEIPGLYGALRDTALVVLSACETAVPVEAPEGDVTEGGLEIAGLANQFRRAGVPRLLASLWQVSDTSTHTLMVGFYEGLGQGRSPAEALSAAQRALLGEPATAHPFHWAPFILIGTPR